MKIYHKIILYVQIVKQSSKDLLFFSLACLLCACTTLKSLPTSGTVTPWGNMDSLIARSEIQADLRKDYLEIQIDISQRQFHVGEIINVKVILTNTSDQDVVVRKPGSMPVIGNDATNIEGVSFLITAIETGVILDRGGIMLSGFVQEALPPPESFAVLPAQKSSIINFDLTEIFDPILAGEYTVQLVYTNNYFGAATRIDSERQFIDYNAWMGTVASNVESFQVLP